MVKILILKGAQSPKGPLKTLQKGLDDALEGTRLEWEEGDIDDIQAHKLALNNTKKIVLVEWSAGFGIEALISLPPKAQIFFYVSEEGPTLADKKALNSLCAQVRWIQGVIDLSRPIEWSIPQLLHALERRQLQNQTKDVAEVGKGLNQLVSMGLLELQRIKKLHERVVSLRKEQFKGVQLVSKYAAGESPGGEFFDVIVQDRHLTLLVSSCSTYLASGLILSHFERWRANGLSSMGEAQKSLMNVAQELEKVGKEVKFEVLLARIDLHSLEVEGLNFGRARLISQKAHYINGNTFPVASGFVDQAAFEFKLTRGEHLAVVSPGVEKNIGAELIGKRSYSSFFAEFLPKGATTLLNELFFELKRGRTSEFLEYDASAIIIEVDPNAIIQI